MPPYYLYLILIPVVLIVGFPLLRLIRRLISPPKPVDEQPPQHDLTLADALELLRSGKINQEEYDRLRQVILANRTPAKPQKSVGFEVLPPRDHI